MTQALNIDNELLKRAIVFARTVVVEGVDVADHPEGLLLVEKAKAVKAFLSHYSEFVELTAFLHVTRDPEVRHNTRKILAMVKSDVHRAADRLLQLEAQGGQLSPSLN